MKRVWVVFSLLLVFLLPSAAAAQSLTAKEAAELVKDRITVPWDVEDFTSNYFEYDGRAQWEFQWQGKKATIHAILDADTGDIVSYYGYGSDFTGQNSLVPKVSKAEALMIAEEFLKKAVPSRYSSLKLSDNIPERAYPLGYNRDYSFYFERVVNGIPCPFCGAQFQVSATTGKITHYYLNWEYKAVFPPAVNTISPQKAAETMKSKGFELMYFRPYPAKEGQERQVKLVYGINQPRQVLVNAITGEFETDNYFYIFRDGMHDKGEMGGMGSAKERLERNELTPIEEEEVDIVANLLSREEAQEAVFKHFRLPEGFALENARLFEDERKDRIWHLGWNMNNGDQGNGYISAAVDALTGELLSYSRSIYYPGFEKETNKYTLAQAGKIGEKFLNEMQSVKMGQTRYADRQDQFEASRTARFTYTRLVDGIPFYEDSLSVEVDRVTGEIVSFYVQWGKFVFPKAAPGITLDAAFKNLTGANPMDMGYLRVEKPKFDRSEQTIGLYYYFRDYQPRLVDAVTGKVLSETGQEYTSEDKVEFTDIAGHPSENDIKLLYSLGVVGDSTGKYYPYDPVMNAAFIKMLVLANGWQPGEGEELDGVPDTWYRPYYQTAVYHGVFPADSMPKPEQEVNRIDCARFLVSAIGLKKAAVLEGIYKVPSKDGSEISVMDAGYAAIALKMGLLPAINGNFEADTLVARGEAASILVQYMQAFDN